jgi:hypothetical protein
MPLKSEGRAVIARGSSTPLDGQGAERPTVASVIGIERY